MDKFTILEVKFVTEAGAEIVAAKFGTNVIFIHSQRKDLRMKVTTPILMIQKFRHCLGTTTSGLLFSKIFSS